VDLEIVVFCHIDKAKSIGGALDELSEETMIRAVRVIWLIPKTH